MWPFGKKKSPEPLPRPKPLIAPPPSYDIAQEDVDAKVYTESLERSNALRPPYRRARHAFQGARAYLTDLATSHYPLGAAVESATGVDREAVIAEARRMLDAMVRDDVVNLSVKERLLLSMAVADFVGVAFYAGYLYRTTFTAAWHREYEHRLDAREPPMPGDDKES